MVFRSELRLRQLRFFKSVSDIGSFTAAAASCGVSQPALSSTIRQFETELGARLFERTTRRVELTRFGRALLPLANAILTNVELASHDIQSLLTSQRLTIRVAATPSLTIHLLPDLIRQFTTRYPDVHVVIQDAPNVAIARLVRDGEVDFGIGIAPFDPAMFERFPLFFDQLVVVCNREHKFYRRKSIPWKLLENETIATYTADSSVYQMSSRIFLDLGMIFHPQTLNYHHSVIGLAAHGLALAILPSCSVEELDHRKLKQIPLVDPLGRRQYSLIVRRKRQMLKHTELFIGQIINEFSEQRNSIISLAT